MQCTAVYNLQLYITVNDITATVQDQTSAVILFHSYHVREGIETMLASLLVTIDKNGLRGGHAKWMDVHPDEMEEELK